MFSSCHFLTIFGHFFIFSVKMAKTAENGKKMGKSLDNFIDLEQFFNGTHKKFIIEVKPKAQCKEPNKTPKRKTRKWYKEVQTWGINQAKWKSATDYCENRGMEFKILTEDHLNPQYK